MEHNFLAMLLVSVVCSLVVGGGSGAFGSYLAFIRFQAMDKEREKHWKEWRDGISRDVDELKKSASLIALAVLSQRMEDMERRLGSIETSLAEHWRLSHE